VTTAEVFVNTALVVTVKVAEILPPGTMTDSGVCTTTLLLCSATVAPPVGAVPFSVTVPVELLPPTTVVGFSVTDDRVAALTVSVAACPTPYDPEMLTIAFAATALVVTVKVAEVLPEATVTVAGTCAEASLLESATTAPPEGAVPFSVTVPVDEAPPRTLVGLSVNEDNCGGFTVNAADFVVP